MNTEDSARSSCPISWSDIFEAGVEAGEIAETARNTIRGRLSQYDGKSVLRLPNRRGWMTRPDRLRDVALREGWANKVHAPDMLREILRDLGGEAALPDVLAERLDPKTLEWLLETLPFDPGMQARLREAGSTSARRELLGGA